MDERNMEMLLARIDRLEAQVKALLKGVDHALWRQAFDLRDEDQWEAANETEDYRDAIRAASREAR